MPGDCGRLALSEREARTLCNAKNNADPSSVGEKIFWDGVIPVCRARRALPWAILFRAFSALIRRAARGIYKDGVKLPHSKTERTDWKVCPTLRLRRLTRRELSLLFCVQLSCN